MQIKFQVFELNCFALVESFVSILTYAGNDFLFVKDDFSDGSLGVTTWFHAGAVHSACAGQVKG